MYIGKKIWLVKRLFTYISVYQYEFHDLVVKSATYFLVAALNFYCLYKSVLRKAQILVYYKQDFMNGQGTFGVGYFHNCVLLHQGVLLLGVN